MGKKNKKINASSKSKEKEEAVSTPPTSLDKQEEEATLAQTFFEHPMIKITKVIVMPYFMYLGYFFLFLQRPEYVSKASFGLFKLRPAVRVEDLRQFLVVGPQSSGTTQISTALKNQLNLEVGHETSDTYWEFVRDGTVSWFHVVRFLDHRGMDRVNSIKSICSNGSQIGNMGFHPAAYRPPTLDCSYRSKWDKCWEAECTLILVNEWSCALNDSCEINFRTNLHHVRNPLRNMESLVVKFCIGGVAGQVDDVFLIFVSALFPEHDFSQDSCIEAAGEFLYLYHTAMMNAKNSGLVDAVYKIDDEESTVCGIAEQAGLLSVDTTVYAPNYETVRSVCVDSDPSHPARQPVPRNRNKVNKGELSLGWEDLQGGKHGSIRPFGDKTLEDKIKKLFKEFGYDTNLHPDEVVSDK